MYFEAWNETSVRASLRTEKFRQLTYQCKNMTYRIMKNYRNEDLVVIVVQLVELWDLTNLHFNAISLILSLPIFLLYTF